MVLACHDDDGVHEEDRSRASAYVKERLAALGAEANFTLQKISRGAEGLLAAFLQATSSITPATQPAATPIR
jgi:hypothetical protein